MLVHRSARGMICFLSKALPFYALVAIDVVAVISGLLAFVEEKSSRKNCECLVQYLDWLLGFVIAWFTIDF